MQNSSSDAHRFAAFAGEGLFPQYQPTVLPIPAQCASHSLSRRLTEVDIPDEDLDVCDFFKLGYGTETQEGDWAG